MPVSGGASAPYGTTPIRLPKLDSKICATACESVIARVAIRGETRSAQRRYAFANRFHLRRFESSPSMLISVGIRRARVIRQSGLLPAMKKMATSGFSTKPACTADRNVCTKVSRYLFLIVGRWIRRAPFHSSIAGSTTCGRQYTETSWPRATSRLVICSTAVSKPL